MSEQANPDLRVLVATPHAVLAEGIRLRLAQEPGLNVVGQVAELAAVGASIEKASPNVVLLDLELGLAQADGGIAQVIGTIKTRTPTIGVVVLAHVPDFALVREAWNAGARAYLLKTATANELVWGLRAVAVGGWYLSPEVVQAVPGLSAGAGKSPLSDREAEVLQLLASGLSSREIGEKLGISARTVETHRVHIMEKLELDDVASLTRFALRSGLR